METSMMFLDCPAFMDRHGAQRCGLPAEVEYRYELGSSDGPLASAKIRCPRGHWFNGPLESLGCLSPSSAVPADRAGLDRGGQAGREPRPAAEEPTRERR
jgi:hypothetical protein